MNQRRQFLIAAMSLPLGLLTQQSALATGVGGTGKPLDLSGFSNKVVLADFWASWCGPCRLSMPWLNSMNEKYAARGLQILGVNLDESRSSAQTFLAEVPVSFDILYDPQGVYAQYYQLQTMPSTIIFSRNGKILSRHNGFLSNRTEEYEQNIITALEA